MADLATKDQDRPPTLSMTPDKLEPLSQAQMDAVDTSDGRSKQPLAGGGVLPRGSSPTEQALGLDSQTSAYGVKARQLQQDQLNATRTANAAGDARNERYLRMMEDQYKATGLQQGELPKWDAKKEREQFQTDPIQAFGSMASVFGILASAFTHAPLTNALNASSAAMNAIRQGDEKGYNEAFDAWKENTLLTYKRHELEQQRFNDATRLLDTNWKLGEAKMRATAVEFGMQSELAMMDSGMWPELFKLQQSKMDAAAGMLRASDTLTNERFKNDLFKQWESAADEEFKGDPNKQAGARLSFAMARNAINSSSPEWQTIGNQVGQWQAQVMHNEKRIPTTEEVSAKIRELKEATTGRSASRGSTDQEWLRLEAEAHPEWTKQELADAFEQHIATKKPPPLTTEQAADRAGKIEAAKQEARGAGKPMKSLDAIKADIRRDHPEMSEGQVAKQAETDLKKAKGTGRDEALGTYKGTGEQNKNLLYATQIERGDRNMEQILGAGYFPGALDRLLFERMEQDRRNGSGGLGILANYALSKEGQQFYQASREFTAGELRRETGAAFNQGELTNTISRYIDAPGDSSKLKEQKKAAREGIRRVTWMGTGLPEQSWGIDAAQRAMSGTSKAEEPAKPAEVPVGAKTKNDQDGHQYRSQGWLWEKRGDSLIPIEPILSESRP